MSSTTLLTSTRFLAMPEEYDKNGNRIKDELIAGEVVRMSPPARIHDLIKNNICELLVQFLRSNPQLGFRSLVEIAFEVDSENTLTPDVSVVSRERLLLDDRVIRGAPEIAIEVVSPSDTAAHMKSKVNAYLRNGSQSAWVVYPDDRSVVLHSAAHSREFKGDLIIDDPLLPGFAAPVSEFFV